MAYSYGNKQHIYICERNQSLCRCNIKIWEGFKTIPEQPHQEIHPSQHYTISGVCGQRYTHSEWLPLSLELEIKNNERSSSISCRTTKPGKNLISTPFSATLYQDISIYNSFNYFSLHHIDRTDDSIDRILLSTFDVKPLRDWQVLPWPAISSYPILQ